jgi:DNA-binding XRE family transcriptional regulator
LKIFNERSTYPTGGKTMENSIRLSWSSVVQEAVTRRKTEKLTQEELAALAGVSKPTLNRFEQGQTNISVENALKILRMLGLAENLRNF